MKTEIIIRGLLAPVFLSKQVWVTHQLRPSPLTKLHKLASKQLRGPKAPDYDIQILIDADFFDN